jgi:hypothetical protein
MHSKVVQVEKFFRSFLVSCSTNNGATKTPKDLQSAKLLTAKVFSRFINSFKSFFGIFGRCGSFAGVGA